MRKAAVLIFAGLLVLLVACLWMSPNDPRTRAEQGHGLRLPHSAREIQNRGDFLTFSDHGLATLFCMSTNDLPAFLAQVTVRSRSAPVCQAGDPSENGYNIWPTDASTFVPGNDQYGGFKRAWHGDPVPMEMLSCASSEGDWLHVELWNLDPDTVLIKLYTDWN